MRSLLAAGVLLLTVVGCGTHDQPNRTRQTTAPTTATAATPVPVLDVQGCVVGPLGQADRRCDPGVPNPDVTQANIEDTICRSGWTETVRPPTSYTSPLRDTEMLRYYPTGTPATAVRYDHLIPLELGGHPTDVDNLWPQPVDASYVKNAQGGRLKDRVCAGELQLAEAQATIVRDWSIQP